MSEPRPTEDDHCLPRKLTASEQYKRVYLLDDDNNIVASLTYLEDAAWIAAAVNEHARLKEMIEIERETSRTLIARLDEIRRLTGGLT